jgi:hypothetical protein
MCVCVCVDDLVDLQHAQHGTQNDLYSHNGHVARKLPPTFSTPRSAPVGFVSAGFVIIMQVLHPACIPGDQTTNA